MTALNANSSYNHSASTHDHQKNTDADAQLASLLKDLKVPTAVSLSSVAEASQAAMNSMEGIAKVLPKISIPTDTTESIEQNTATALNFVKARAELVKAIEGLGSALKPIADYQKVLPDDADKITAGHDAVSKAIDKFTTSITAAKEARLITPYAESRITEKLNSVYGLVNRAKGLETVVAPPTEQKIDYSSVPNLTFTSGWEFIERERNKQDILAKCKWEGELEGKLERTGVLDYINREFKEAPSLTNEGLKDPGGETAKDLGGNAAKTLEKLKEMTDELKKFPMSFGDYLTKDGLLTGLWRGVQTIGSFGILGYSTVANQRSGVAADVERLIAETQRLELAAAAANAKAATERDNAIAGSMRSVKEGLSSDLKGMKWLMDNKKPEDKVDPAEAFLREVSIPAERRITHVEGLIEDLKTRGFVAEGEAIKLTKGEHTLSFTRRTDGSVYMELNGTRQNGFLWTDKVEAVVAAFEADPKSVAMEKEPDQQTMVVQAVEKRVAA